MCRRTIYLTLFILVLGLAGATAAQDIDPNLVGWWKLNETSGFIAADSSGLSNDGTVYGGAQWIAGQIDGALDFDGVDDYVDLPIGSLISTLRSTTLSIWANFSNTGGGWQRLWDFGTGPATTPAIYMFLTPRVATTGAMRFAITTNSNAGEYGLNAPATLPSGWHQVTVVIDGENKNMQLYLDGDIVASGLTQTLPADLGVTNQNWLGRSQWSEDAYYIGSLDDFRIYNRALTMDEVDRLGPPRLSARRPQPADGGEVTTTVVTLSWTAGQTADSHHVYFGENLEDVQNGTADTDKGITSETTYLLESLETDKTYYWRVDEVEADGVTTYTGPVWSFTISSKITIPVAVSQKPVLDGVIDDVWSLSTEQFITITLEGVDPDSPADCSGSWRALWDFDYLYILIDVNDEALVQDSSAAVGWDDDRVEVFVDGDNSRNTSNDGVNDYQYCFRWNYGLVETPVEWYFSSTPHPAGSSLEGVKYGIATTDSGYIFEIALPWSTMIGGPPQEGQLIGIDVMIDDDDDGGVRDTQISWHTEAPPPHNPSKWGTALLGIVESDKAWDPRPADEAIEVPRDAILSWRAGKYAVTHDVYFGTDINDVSEASIADTRGVLVSQNQDDMTYDPAGLLDFSQSYYWRVDEVNDLHPDSPWKGDVWSFTTLNFTVVDDFEDYNDVSNRIFDTWADYAVNNTGMTVGYFDPPFAEQTIVHSGRQAMYMRYDNDGTVNEGTNFEQAGTLLYSEAERQWADAQDWTAEGAVSLTLWFRGKPGSVGSFTEGPPITMTAIGVDITGRSDQFHFAYKRLSGEGSITAKVLSVENTNPLAKAGVMIRQTLAADSPYAMVVAMPGNRVSFQSRINTGGASQATQRPGVTIPQWVRLTRTGNTFTAHYSANGTTWTALGTPLDMSMLVDVYVGLCLTSRNVDAICTAEFSDVDISGTVTGDWKSQDIGIEVNAPEQLYIVLEDGAANSAVVKHPDPAATTIDTWSEWNILLSDFTGVNLQAINKISIGVGDRANTEPGGAGDLYIDDIRLYLPPPAE